MIIVLTSIQTLQVGAEEGDKEVEQEKTYVGEGYEINFKVIKHWEDSFNADITITNTSDSLIDNWAIGFDMPHEITSIWGAIIESDGSGHYVIKNTGDNQDIKAKESVKFGFTASYEDKITIPIRYEFMMWDLNVPNENYEAKAEIVSDWKSGYNGNITITNTSDNVIEDWTIEFDFAHNIEKFFTAEILSHDDNHYIVKNSGHNANIKPGQSISLGFDGNPGDVTEEIKNIKIKHVSTSLEELNRDSDGDGISDGAELKLGLDPLNKDSDQDGVPDGDEKIEQTLAETIECEEAPQITEVSVSINGTGLIDETTKIKNTFGIDTLTSDVVGLVGIPVDISTTSSFDEATIKFTYNDDLLGETSEENLRIMWYDEENNQYVIMDEETVLDTEDNTLSLTTDHFSTYLVVDRQEWYDAWSNAISYRRDPETPSIPIEYFDICYIIDRSGSMSGDRITMAKDAIRQFINAMYSQDRASIVGYDSSAKVYSDFTDNKQSLKDSLSSIYASGGTSVEAGLVAALDLFDSTGDNYVNGIANTKMIERIILQLEDDIPVPTMAGFNDKRIMKRVDLITGEYILNNNGEIIKNKLDLHWVNIVGMEIDKIKGTRMLEVASWGKKYLVDFDDYYNESELIDGVIWIE